MFPLQDFLKRQQAADLYRTRRVCEGQQGPRQRCDGKEMLSFCSNDYLGLAANPEIAESMRKATERYGVGSGAAHLVNGHSHAHHALEEELADFVGRERALLFSTGYMANLGTVSALVERGDFVIADKLVHASLIDAAKLSGARLQRYLHNEPDALQHRLVNTTSGKRLVVTDGIFSMDGDIAQLPELVSLTRDDQTALLVDDAHGFGVLGKQGRGSADQFGCHDDIDILMGTLGKAFGTFGAFVAGSNDLIETLIQKSRSYIYTTALPAAVVEATRTSLRLVKQADDRREKLQQLIKHFRSSAKQLGLELSGSQTPIQPLVLGTAEQALNVSQQLEQAGILVTAIRPPTVPEGSARLRITFSATHTEQDVDQLLLALEQCL